MAGTHFLVAKTLMRSYQALAGAATPNESTCNPACTCSINQVNKAGEDEEAIPDDHGIARRQKSMAMLHLDVGQSFEEDDEDDGEDNENDDDNDGSSKASNEDSK